MTIRTTHFPPPRTQDPSQLGKPNGHAQSVTEEVQPVRDKAHPINPLDLMAALQRDAKLLARQVGAASSSHERHGCLMIARNAALRVQNNLERLIEFEESL